MKPGPGLAFLLAVALLVGTTEAAFRLAGASTDAWGDASSFRANEERAVLVKNVRMTPGDRLVVRPDLPDPGVPTFAGYEMFVVDGGGSSALLEGRAPRTVYAHVGNLSARSCCTSPWLVWERPDDAHARRPSSVVWRSTPEEETRTRLSQPDRIDVVWVLRYAPDAALPQTPEAWKDFEARMEARMLQPQPFDPVFQMGVPIVVQERAARLQPYLYAAMAASALAAAGAAAAWLWRLRRADAPLGDAGSEPLLRLYDAAGAHLASLRDLLVGSFAVALAVAFHASLHHDVTLVHVLDAAGIATGALRALEASLALLYGVVLLGWAYAVWRVQRALSRWRRRRAAPPLEP